MKALLDTHAMLVEKGGTDMESNYHRDLAADPRSTDELIAAMVADWGKAFEQETHGGTQAQQVLEYRGGQAEFDAACRLIARGGSVERQVGAALLGELGLDRPTFVTESVAVLLPLLTDPDPKAVAAAVFALGRRPDCIGAPHIIPLRRHPSPEVRHGVAVGLGGCESPEALAALAELTGDADETVRDWATFGLGDLCETDAPFIREALWARVQREAEESGVFWEGVMGLAKRRDPDLYPILLRLLEGDARNGRTFDAAALLGDRRLLERLQALRAGVVPEDNRSWVKALDEAMAVLSTPEDGHEQPA